ncbi:hypothetical protein ABB37_00759 [Leptomonas pyrrhocoris]|uniref:Zeta toxin domain-containing protein n=1 Tax=Leptomonas pyrrhocoris TaxID=157538 RepID=A0A0M9GB41_LEPPY|nr:hypothetical protein ABB37_00759 [Leptomonas pyrrhocoris]KPA86657.1 hypothetical protein ABB37_00759 [Leptomonas pyrrhocoris]|eukprot:XP_015665096.1 hypothetical protein ABB37_00759 [Leptomonas pyrrhocoris]
MSSKYDVVKLKVHLSSAHYYILSRFLLSRMLMFCRIPEDAAVRISLAVKKHFVNGEQTSITQDELEAHLQSAITAFGFSEAHTRLFPVVTQFHTERIPLVLLIAGPACRGKTTLAHLLSARLNCSTIINTEVLHDINAAIDDLLLKRLPVNAVAATSELSASHRAEAHVVAAVNAEVDKAMREGKVVIVEGERLRLAHFRHFLDPAFQISAGAVLLGFVLDSLDRSASTVCAEYNETAVHLRPVYTTECVSVMCAAREENSTCGDCAATAPSVYVARCRAVGDNLELSAFLHNVVVERIMEELQHRGKMTACAEATEGDDNVGPPS